MTMKENEEEKVEEEAKPKEPTIEPVKKVEEPKEEKRYPLR